MIVKETNYLALFAKSFNWAGFFLPKDTYEECSKLYAFCRVLDDVADTNQNLKIKKERFNELKEVFKEIETLKNNDLQSSTFEKNKVVISDMIVISEYKKIPDIVIKDLVDGVESDLKEKIQFNTVKELLVYSYRVAGTVGLMMAKILNVSDKRALKGAIDLGIAMQLTNISRDVVEDYKMNREYIKDDFENIKSTLKLADMFYESSFSSLKKIPIRYRFAIIVARRVYRQIGREIIKKKNIENYRRSGKIYVDNFGKITQTILSFIDLIKLFFITIENHQRSQEHDIIKSEINLNERI
tara:strand:- start:4303 stop:5199 length:897 start_codon:yes stop_codon:yes gene_type:complete